MKKEYLIITPEEEKAISLQCGVNYERMNELLGNYISNGRVNMYIRKGYDHDDYTEEEIKELVNRATDIYSAMVKKKLLGHGNATLYRGVGKIMRSDDEFGFISTSEQPRGAEIFADSRHNDFKEEDHIMKLLVNSDVPFITISAGIAQEQEVLISPFVTLEKLREGELRLERGRTKHCAECRVIEKKPIQHPKEVVEKAYGRLLNNLPRLNELIHRYLELSYDMMEKPIAHGNKKQRELLEQIHEIKSDFRLIVEAKCFDMERSLEEKHQHHLTSEQEERRSQVTGGVQAQKQTPMQIQAELRERLVGIFNEGKNVALNSIRGAIEYADKLRSVVNYDETSSPTLMTKSLIENTNIPVIREVTYDRTLQEAQVAYQNLHMEMQDGNIVPSLMDDEENVFKRAMFKDLIEIRFKQELSMIFEEESKLEKASKNRGLFGKIIGGKKSEDDFKRINERKMKILAAKKKIETGDIKVGGVNKDGITTLENYSAHDLMAEVEFARRIDDERKTLYPDQREKLERYKKALEDIYIRGVYSGQKDRVNQDVITSKCNIKIAEFKAGRSSEEFVELCDSKAKIRGDFHDSNTITPPSLKRIVTKINHFRDAILSGRGVSKEVSITGINR